jgi:predicted Zn-dependent protease with MMP-like domain
MNMPLSRFEELVAEAMDSLPEQFRERINNLAIFVEDFPSPEQLDQADRHERDSLLGLFEGYAQSRRLNFGVVLPDRITLFRKPILASCGSEKECRERIRRVLRHEIAHHFGSEEAGARRSEIGH